LKIVVFGLSITSSWGNGHATTYRALLEALRRRGHQIVFFEKDEPWYASNRDLPSPEFCDLRLFDSWDAVLPGVRRELSDCDVAVLGSFFSPGIRAADEIRESKAPVTAFYDIDTPITLAKLRAGEQQYLRADQVAAFDLYLSFTGGPILQQLQEEFGARLALPLYCSFEPSKYYPRRVSRRFQCDLSYMGTYAADRQRKLEELLFGPANRLPDRRFILAGPQYPKAPRRPKNVKHIMHLSPQYHPQFYSSCRFTLNLTREEMVRWGYSPSVRLFEAAACGCAIISDFWPGLDSMLKVGDEVLLADSAEQVSTLLQDMEDGEIQRIGRCARERVLAEHSSDRRAEEFENYVASASGSGLPAGHRLKVRASSLSEKEQRERSSSTNLVAQ
jgi:spore maturation protein CgeB